MSSISLHRPAPGGCLRRIVLPGLLLAPMLWVLGLMGITEYVGRQDDRARSGAIVVMGTAQFQGTPSRVFRARLEHAHALYADGVAPLVVVAGGKLDGDLFTEARAGTRFLRRNGVPRRALLAVGRGDNTLSSLVAVDAVLERRGIEEIVLVSDRFHMFRALRMAQDLELDAHGSPTPASPVDADTATRLRYTLREVAAVTYYLLSRPWMSPEAERAPGAGGNGTRGDLAACSYGDAGANVGVDWGTTPAADGAAAQACEGSTRSRCETARSCGSVDRRKRAALRRADTQVDLNTGVSHQSTGSINT